MKVWKNLVVTSLVLMMSATVAPELGQAGITSAVVSKVTTKCTDSDGGKDKSSKGKTRGVMWTDQNAGTKSYEDSCKDASTVKEFFCVKSDGTTAGDDFVYFNNTACSSGTACSDGVCVAASSSCSDSDSGANTSVKGTVTVGSATYTDTCCTNGVSCGGYTDSGRVKEYSCSGSNVSAVYPACSSGKTCQDGACK